MLPRQRGRLRDAWAATGSCCQGERVRTKRKNSFHRSEPRPCWRSTHSEPVLSATHPDKHRHTHLLHARLPCP